MSPRISIAAFVACAACTGDFDGTAVGNPSMDAQLARIDGATVTEATMQVDAVDFTDCDGAATTAHPATLDLVAADPIAMPGVPVCGIAVRATGQIRIDGSMAGGFFLDAQIQTAGLDLSPDTVGPGAFVLEVGTPGFIDTQGIEEDVQINAGSDGYDAIRAAIDSGSKLFSDPDEDGVISEEERAAGPLATSEPLDGDDESERHEQDVWDDDRPE